MTEDLYGHIDYELLKRILDEVPSNIFFKDTEGKYQFMTHQWRQIKGNGLIDGTVLGKTDMEIRIDKDNAKAAHEADMEIIRTGKGTSYTIKFEHEGKVEYLELTKNPVRDSEGNIIGIVGLINDVTKNVLLQQQLERLALTDQLTGLYNRQYLNKFYTEENIESIYPLVIMAFDCDGLKYINDTFGHQAGDAYIKKSASAIRIVLPDAAYVFRLGGDEFLAIVPSSTREDAIKYLKRLKDVCETIRVFDEQISISAGYKIVEEHKSDLTDEICEADNYMYENKREHHLGR